VFLTVFIEKVVGWMGGREGRREGEREADFHFGE
jgi:hypothetical protein